MMQSEGEITHVPTFGYADQKICGFTEQKLDTDAPPPPETPALLRPRGHRRSPSAPPSLPSPAAGPAPQTPGSSTRAAMGVSPERTLVQVTRIEGSFGLTLNPFNRVTDIKKDSPAYFGGVRMFDRITHVDGLRLEGKMSEAVRGRNTVELGIERPPSGYWAAIAAKENHPDSTSPLVLRTPGLVLGTVPASPLGPRSTESSVVVEAVGDLDLDAESTTPTPEAVAAPPAAASGNTPSPNRHRRNVSEPIKASALGAAALHSMQTHPFWQSAAAAPAAPPAAPPAAAAAPADAGSSDGSAPSSPRSVVDSAKEQGAKASSKKDDAAEVKAPEKRSSWWGSRRKSLRDPSAKEAPTTAVPLMAFAVDGDDDDVESC